MIFESLGEKSKGSLLSLRGNCCRIYALQFRFGFSEGQDSYSLPQCGSEGMMISCNANKRRIIVLNKFSEIILSGGGFFIIHGS